MSILQNKDYRDYSYSNKGVDLISSDVVKNYDKNLMSSKNIDKK